MKSRTALVALVVASTWARLSVPALAVTSTTYMLNGCSAGSPINGNLISATSAPYAPANCTAGAGSGTASGIGAPSALTSVQAISNTGDATHGVVGGLQSAYIGVYPSLGVTSTAGVDANLGSTTNLNGSTGSLAANTTLVTTSTGNVLIESTGAPQHAMDNSFNQEALLLNFSSLVSLTGVQLGYYNTDSDITIYEYTGLGPYSAPTGGNLTWTSLTSNGWTKVGDYADVGGAPTTGNGSPGGMYGITPAATLSSHWLVAAYTGSANPSTQGVLTAPGQLSAGNDFVKLLEVNACTGAAGCGIPPSSGGGGVPEPPTMLLVGVALLGLMELRRRQII